MEFWAYDSIFFALQAGLVLAAIVLAMTGIVLGIRNENGWYFVVCICFAYCPFAAVVLINSALQMLGWPLDMFLTLAGLAIPPGLFLFFTGCCVESRDQSFACYFGSTLSFVVCFFFVWIYIQAIISI